MSDFDRERWNARYREGAYAERTHPGALLADWAPRILAEESRDGTPKSSGELPRALDLACGAGRNALYLARLGYRVLGVDIADEALARAQHSAAAQQLDVQWLQHDLEQPLPTAITGGRAAGGPDDASDGYDLVVLLRYLDLDLVGRAAALLRAGGHLVCEVHLDSDDAAVGPRNARFRAPPGALRAAASELELRHYHEGPIVDPDGRSAAVAQLVARRRSMD